MPEPLEFPLELDFEEIVLPEELEFFFLQFLSGTCHVFHGSRFESRWDLDFLLNILYSYYHLLMRTFLEASDSHPNLTFWDIRFNTSFKDILNNLGSRQQRKGFSSFQHRTKVEFESGCCRRRRRRRKWVGIFGHMGVNFFRANPHLATRKIIEKN